ncbi:ABC transporter ATP-binding protein [Streptococcus pluranimalium]|uniref:ABC transporter ATP-binding protein n=1 Tax=Streptococcus pluranimalium TaxID=82348 RepID=UPI0039FC6917
MKALVSVSDISKTIKGKQVLDAIFFEITRGECVALIGQNGAGKSSLLKCIIGDWNVNKGSIVIQQLSPTNGQLKGKIAVLSQENTIPINLKVKELITFFRSVVSHPLSIDKVISYLGFDQEQYDDLAGKLSGGQRRLLAFILCLIGQPEILILDEPTAGMDTATRKRFWEIIGELKEQGVSILYSSHYIEEVEHTADRILVLHKGRLIRDTTPYEMRYQEDKQVTLPLSFLDEIQGHQDCYDMLLKKDCFQFRTKNLVVIWDELYKEGLAITDIEIQNMTLLDTLFETTKEIEHESLA